MASRIPSADQVGRKFANPVTAITRVDTSNVGKGLQIVATAVDKGIDTVSRYQYAQAASEFLVKKNTEDNAYADDQDYGTIENRYSKNIDKSLQDSANLIMDPRLRNEFMLKFRPEVAEGVSRIRSVASSKEKDYQRGYVNQQLEALTEAGLTGDMDTALATSTALLETARDSGYISAQEYQQLNTTQRQNMAVKSIEMLEPKQQLEALNTPVVKANLPADVEVKLRKAAEAELVKGEAVVAVDDIMSSIRLGGSRIAAQARIEQIEDPDIRTAVEQRFENEYNRHEANKAQLQEGLNKKYAVQLRLGEMTFDQIPRADLNDMDPSTLASLQSAERTAASGPPQNSDRNVLLNVFALQARAENPNLPPLTPEQLGQLGIESDTEMTAAQASLAYAGKNQHLLNPQDFEQYVGAAVKGVVPAEAKPFMTARARLSNELRLMYPKDTAKVYAKEIEFDRWYSSQATPPTDSDVREHMDLMILDTFKADPDPTGWLFNFDKPWAELTPTAKQQHLQNLMNDDPVMAEIYEANPTATADVLMAKYQQAKR